MAIFILHHILWCFHVDICSSEVQIQDEKERWSEWPDIKVRRSQTIISEVQPLELMDKIKQDPELGKMSIEKVNDEVKLNSKMSWHSFGEKVRIKINPLSSGKNEYHITSKPKYILIAFDYWVNKENVDNVVKLLHGN